VSARYWFPFMLNSELDMLECQLFENYDRVHRFIVVEATLTHQGGFKPLHYAVNEARFAPYADKIIHVVCDYLPTREQVADPWVRERMQRDAGLASFMPYTEPDDIVIVSDVDEIPSSAAFAQDPQPVLGGNIYLRFATADTPGGPGVMQVLVRAGAVSSVDQLRQRREGFPSYDQAGWHLSWFGGQAAIREKLHSFCHLETFEYGMRANDANVMWAHGMGWVPEDWDGTVTPAPVVDVPWVTTREERDALPWEQQMPLWVHRRLCPEVWWRPKEEAGNAL
jgi:Glycosyltransferase family 17